MIIYEPITMLEPTIPMIGKRCISKAEKHDLGVITEMFYDNSLACTKMVDIGFAGRGYYNWLAVFGYPKDHSIMALMDLVSNFINIKCLIADYGPHNDQIVEIK
jgi:hypothetical protein